VLIPTFLARTAFLGGKLLFGSCGLLAPGLRLRGVSLPPVVDHLLSLVGSSYVCASFSFIAS
jgi:hypothetical protein